MKTIHKLVLALLAGTGLSIWFITAGCQDTGGAGGGARLFGAGSGSEKWTIRCRRIDTPDHAREAETLANMLRQVKQLDPKAVRVSTEDTGSNIYYGEYKRVPTAAGSDQLTFPPEFQRDLSLIRSLSDGISAPFLSAQAELVGSGAVSEHPEWEATNAPGTHSLLIGVFYNTEGFQQRKEVAEQYVSMLREDGFTAYYYHEPIKSFVFVGDFTEADLVRTPEGLKPGPRVEQLIARREAEFRHFTENGHIRKYYEGPGREVAPFTQVVPVPRKR